MVQKQEHFFIVFCLGGSSLAVAPLFIALGVLGLGIDCSKTNGISYFSADAVRSRGVLHEQLGGNGQQV